VPSIVAAAKREALTRLLTLVKAILQRYQGKSVLPHDDD
jgi:hypothetical protein